MLEWRAVSARDPHEAIRDVFRTESARLVGGLVRLVRDVGMAEEVAQDALVAALEQWPEAGIPNNPGAWLQAVARNRAINVIRRNALVARKHERLAPLSSSASGFVRISKRRSTTEWATTCCVSS